LWGLYISVPLLSFALTHTFSFSSLPPSLPSLPQTTGFRKFVAADEVAHWFAARLSPPSSRFSAPPSRPPSLPPCRYFTMQDEKWRTCNSFPLPLSFRAFRLLAGGGLVEGEGEEEEEGGREGGQEGGREGGTTMTLHVDLHKARTSKGPTRYTTMTHVFLPVRRSKGGRKRREGGREGEGAGETNGR